MGKPRELIANPFGEIVEEEDVKNPFEAESHSSHGSEESDQSSQFNFPVDADEAESETSFHYPASDEDSTQHISSGPERHSPPPTSAFQHTHESFLELPPAKALTSHLNSLIRQANLHSLERLLSPTPVEVGYWEKKYNSTWPGAFEIINEASSASRTGGSISAAAFGNLEILKLLMNHGMSGAVAMRWVIRRLGAMLNVTDQSGKLLFKMNQLLTRHLLLQAKRHFIKPFKTITFPVSNFYSIMNVKWTFRRVFFLTGLKLFKC
ncbi:hypothetical protein BT69DRAFT_1143833 [Atractiella rhizophila]|nr:hypothetical protein BT69DRAFT_1143833 [Atractiella rhizophila]